MAVRATPAEMDVKYSGQLKNLVTLAIIAVAAFLIGLEAYAFATVSIEGWAGLPRNIGNFERIRNALGKHQPQEKFSFAVVGDTRQSVAFERICDELRNEQLSFMVMLGDFVEAPTKGNHGYFRFECRNKCRLPFPVLLLAGERDVVFDERYYDVDKVSLTDFEQMYGPRNFSFEYDGCLFVGLCILPRPVPTEESVQFLESVLAAHRDQDRKVFVFTHTPPVRSTGVATDSFENVQAFMDVVDHCKVDYVISSDYHCCDRIVRKDTVYLVTGGGEAPLHEKETSGGLCHTLLLTIDHDSVSEKVVVAPSTEGPANALRHFAIAELAPFLRKHSALAAVENLLVFGILFLSLGNLIGWKRITTLWSGSERQQV